MSGAGSERVRGGKGSEERQSMGWAREPGDAQGDERFRENVNERMPTCPGNSRTASKPQHSLPGKVDIRSLTCSLNPKP
jgi:hypothetical protein